MALDRSALSELLDALRAGGDLDVVREGLALALQAMIEAEAAEVIGAGRYERTASSNMNAAVHTSTRVHRCRDDVPRTSAICLTTQPVAVSWRLRSAGVTAKRVLQHRTTLCDSQVRLEIAAVGGADRRSARNAARPMNQSREAHLATWPLHSPRGHLAPDASRPCMSDSEPRLSSVSTGQLGCGALRRNRTGDPILTWIGGQAPC